MDQIHIKLGRNLNKIRKGRGWSLDRVAEATGVSKAMLGQIERGLSNPTISVMWKIANGLQMSFTSLLEDDGPDVSIVSRNQVDPLVEEEGAYRIYPLFPFDAKTKIEIYWVEIDIGCVHISEPHNPGVEEYIMVQEGELEIDINGSLYRLAAGQAVRFNAAHPHTYMNKSAVVARYYTSISYP